MNDKRTSTHWNLLAYRLLIYWLGLLTKSKSMCWLLLKTLITKLKLGMSREILSVSITSLLESLRLTLIVADTVTSI